MRRSNIFSKSKRFYISDSLCISAKKLNREMVRSFVNLRTFLSDKKKIKMIIRDTFTEQLTPHQIDVGHLSENPSGWEERYERKNLKSQRFQGKV